MRVRTFRRSIYLILLIGLLLTAAVVATTYFATVRFAELYDQRRRAFDVERITNRLLQLLADAETGQRDFLYTGKPQSVFQSAVS